MKEKRTYPKKYHFPASALSDLKIIFISSITRIHTLHGISGQQHPSRLDTAAHPKALSKG